MESPKKSPPAARRARRTTDPGQNQEPPQHYNRLLAALSPDDLALLKGDLKPETWNVRKVIEKRNARIERACFPDCGIISVVAVADKTEVEVGLIG